MENDNREFVFIIKFGKSDTVYDKVVLDAVMLPETARFEVSKLNEVIFDESTLNAL